MAELEQRELGASFAESDICDIDSLHYLGEKAIEKAIEQLNIQPGAAILDIGSGLGGPARSLAERVKSECFNKFTLNLDFLLRRETHRNRVAGRFA